MYVVGPSDATREFLATIVRSELPSRYLLAVARLSDDDSTKHLLYYPMCVRHNVSALLTVMRDRNTTFAVRQEIAVFLGAMSGLRTELSPGEELANQQAIDRWLAWWDENHTKSEEAWLRQCLKNLVTALGSESLAERRFAAETLLTHTGRNFGFTPDAPAPERRQAQRLWEAWRKNKLQSNAWLRDAAVSSIDRTRILAAYTMSHPPDREYVDWLVALLKREGEICNPWSSSVHQEAPASGLALFVLTDVGTDRQLFDAALVLAPSWVDDLSLAKAYLDLRRGNVTGLSKVGEYMGEYYKRRVAGHCSTADEVRARIALYCAERFCPDGPDPLLPDSHDLARYFEATRKYYLRWSQWIPENLGKLEWNKAAGVFEVKD